METITDLAMHDATRALGRCPEDRPRWRAASFYLAQHAERWSEHARAMTERLATSSAAELERIAYFRCAMAAALMRGAASCLEVSLLLSADLNATPASDPFHDLAQAAWEAGQLLSIMKHSGHEPPRGVELAAFAQVLVALGKAAE